MWSSSGLHLSLPKVAFKIVENSQRSEKLAPDLDRPETTLTHTEERERRIVKTDQHVQATRSRNQRCKHTLPKDGIYYRFTMKTCDESSKLAISCYITIYEPSIYKSECPRSVVRIVTLFHVPVLKIVISGLSEDWVWLLNWVIVDLSNIKGLKCDKSYMPKVPQTVWGLLRNYWPLKFFIPAFSNVWNRPIFHDVAKPVQIGTCQPTMIFVSSQKEYKREKVYCSVQTTQTQGWWPLAPVFLHSKAGLFLLFHVSSDENMDSPCGLLVLQIFPDEERERASTSHQSSARLCKRLLVQ